MNTLEKIKLQNKDYSPKWKKENSIYKSRTTANVCYSIPSNFMDIHMYCPEELEPYKSDLKDKVFTLELLAIIKKSRSKLEINLLRHIINIMEDDNQFKYVRKDFADLFGSHYISISKKLKVFGRGTNFILSSWYQGRGGTDRKFMVNPYMLRTQRSQVTKKHVEFWDTLVKIKGLQYEAKYIDENYF